MDMRKKRKDSYTKEQLDFLEEGYKHDNIRNLTIKFNERFGQNRTYCAIQTVCMRNGFRSGRKPKERLINRFRVFDELHNRFITDAYKKLSVKDLVPKFNEKFNKQITEKQLRNLLARRGIISGRTGCFPKGNKPWNTGTKGATGANSGSFKKGTIPPKTKPIGSERVESKDGYQLVKVGGRRYKPKHALMWEQENGPVPDGYVVAFKDGNNRNIKIDNLMLASKEKMLRLNKRGYKNKPMPIKESLLALTDLECKITERKRNGKG